MDCTKARYLESTMDAAPWLAPRSPSAFFVALAFAGFGAELDSRRSRLPVYLTGQIVCAVMLLIQDPDRPDAEPSGPAKR